MSREIKVCNVDTLNDVNDRVRSLQNSVKRDIDRAKRDAEEKAIRIAEQRIASARDDMKNRLDRALNKVDDRFRRINEEHNRKLTALANEIHGNMADIRRWTYDNIDDIRKNMKSLNDDINSRFRSQQLQISDLENRVDKLFDQIAEDAARTSEAVSAIRKERDAAFEALPIERFLPEEAREIDVRIAQLDPNVSACIANVKEINARILLAKERAIIAQEIYNGLHIGAMTLLEGLLDIIHKNRTQSVSDPDGHGSVLIETDFWMRGAYSSLIDELEALKKELETNPKKERIEEIIQSADEIQKRMADMLEISVKKAMLSENRVVITEDIVTALINQGYEIKLEEDGKEALQYMGGEQDNDWREGVYAILRKAGGEEITIIVRPDEMEINNQIIFHRNDSRNITDAQYIESLQRIKLEIEQSGHKLGQIQAPVGGGNEQIPQLRSSQSLSRKGAADMVKSQIRTNR